MDTPERIVVMTTNHPEILDPALIRPGRIDQKLLLGYMNARNVIEMIKHYFQVGRPPPFALATRAALPHDPSHRALTRQLSAYFQLGDDDRLPRPREARARRSSAPTRRASPRSI